MPRLKDFVDGKRLIILCLDGLGANDLPSFFELIPKTASFLRRLQQLNLVATPLVSAQASWAELLTGRPWYENGCAGYSKPVNSLNHLEVFSEEDLLCPIKLLLGGPSIVVNVPLLNPADENRIWLSDGSGSSIRTVSPTLILNDELLNQYEPRPYYSVVQSLSSLSVNLDRCLKSERTRVDCAMRLLKNQTWQRCILRLSIFDNLSHLLGTNYLKHKKLQASEAIGAFLSYLDEQLSPLFEQKDVDVVLMSCFSHVPCQGRFNLNNLLVKGRLAIRNVEQSHKIDTNIARRMAALTAIFGDQATGVSEKMLDAEQSVAASPVAGAVFINDKERFTDGVVSKQDFDGTKKNVFEYLHHNLTESFGRRVHLSVNPNPQSTHKNTPVPDILVYIDGIEFYDVEEPRLSNADRPRSIHAPEGFSFLSSTIKPDSSTVTPSQLCELLIS